MILLINYIVVIRLFKTAIIDREHAYLFMTPLGVEVNRVFEI
jgi:hypothetical protein